MKKIVVFLLGALLVFSGCARNMLSHTGEKEMERHVSNRVNEDFTLVEVIDEEDTEDKVTYVYKLSDRDITFRAVSIIDAIYVDGSNMGYEHYNVVYYEKDIIFNEENMAFRMEIAEEYGISDEINDNYPRYETYIKNYDQLDELTEFLIEMDYIYDFDEKDPAEIVREENGVGYIDSNGEKHYMTSIEYAPYGDKKLTYEQLFPYLEKYYVKNIIRKGYEDVTIPQHIYDKYSQEMSDVDI